MKKLLLLTLMLFSTVAFSQQEYCWGVNTAEKDGEKFTLSKTEICLLDSKDIILNLEGDRFIFKYVSHKYVTIQNEESVEVTTKTNSGTYYKILFTEELGVLVANEKGTHLVWYYVE